MKKYIYSLLIFTTMGLLSFHCGEDRIWDEVFLTHSDAVECKSREKKILPTSQTEERAQIVQYSFDSGLIPNFAGFWETQFVENLPQLIKSKKRKIQFLTYWNKIQMRM